MRQRIDTTGELSPIHLKITPKKIFFILLANTLIAFFIFATRREARLIPSVIYSQCIGICIATCTIAAANLFKKQTLNVQVLLVTVAMFLGAGIGITAGRAATGLLPQGAIPAIPPGASNTDLVTNLLYALLFGSVIRYVFFLLQKMSDEKIKQLEAEKNSIATEIRLLQSQRGALVSARAIYAVSRSLAGALIIRFKDLPDQLAVSRAFYPPFQADASAVYPFRSAVHPLFLPFVAI